VLNINSASDLLPVYAFKPLIKLSKKELEEMAYNPIEIAKKEFESGKIPIHVKRSLPSEKKVEEEN